MSKQRAVHMRYTYAEAAIRLREAGFVYAEGSEVEHTDEEGTWCAFRVYVRATDNRKVLLWWFDVGEAYLLRRVAREEVL